jgi:hypothetical protein
MSAIVVNPNLYPVNLDRQILHLQTVLSALPWLEYSFGRAWKAYRQSQNTEMGSPSVYGGSNYKRLRKNEICYPNVYKGHGEYQDMLPDDKLKSYCFFVPTDGLSSHSYVAFPGLSNNSYSSALDIVFYYNFNKIDIDMKYPFTDNLIQDVLRVLRSVSNYKVENIYYELKNVFKDYSFDAVSTQYMVYPFGGFRISGTLIFDEDLSSGFPGWGGEGDGEGGAGGGGMKRC